MPGMFFDMENTELPKREDLNFILPLTSEMFDPSFFFMMDPNLVGKDS